MQAVGQFVRLGADEARLHLVHGPVELLDAHPAQLLREERLHPGVDGLKERVLLYLLLKHPNKFILYQRMMDKLMFYKHSNLDLYE